MTPNKYKYSQELLKKELKDFWCCLPKLATVILSKFPTSFGNLRILLTPKCQELSYKKIDNNDA
jgi:hypothetical protein